MTRWRETTVPRGSHSGQAVALPLPASLISPSFAPWIAGAARRTTRERPERAVRRVYERGVPTVQVWCRAEGPATGSTTRAHSARGGEHRYPKAEGPVVRASSVPHMFSPRRAAIRLPTTLLPPLRLQQKHKVRSRLRQHATLSSPYGCGNVWQPDGAHGFGRASLGRNARSVLIRLCPCHLYNG